MARWIIDVQGYREILDSLGNAVKRRKTLQVVGATVTDDGAVTVIEVPPGATGATGAAGATGATGAALLDTGLCVLREDFLCVSPALTADGQFSGDAGSWNFDLIAGTADVGQRQTIQSGHPGQLQIAVGPTTGEIGIVYGDSSRLFRFSDFRRVTVVFRTSAIFTDVVTAFGLASVANTPNTANSGLFFRADTTTSANWRAMTRDGAAQTANVDTGVAIVGSTYQVFVIERDTGTNDLTFKINGATVASIDAATHQIDSNDEYKLVAYCDNNASAVTNQIYDLVLYESSAVDRTTP